MRAVLPSYNFYGVDVIRYTDSLDIITQDKLAGFFVGWPNPPSTETHLRILQGSYRVWLAVDDDSGNVIGFISAISDGVLAAFIPNLEVLPKYQGQGIGTELVKRMFDSLKHLYSIDLICDEDVRPFYERLQMRSATGMVLRYYENQAGRNP
jgi:ribosomal protein S18 acetylase RimI-like enzyme